MNTQTVTLLFWLYKSKRNKSGKSPIYLRITFRGKKIQFSTGQFIHASEWDRERQRVKGKSDQATLINMVLRKLEDKVIKTQAELLLRNGEISFEELRCSLSGTSPSGSMLMDVFQKHNERMLSLVGKVYARATFEIYEITKNEVQEFLVSKLNRRDIALKDLSISFIQDLEVFYRLEKGNQTNTIYKKFQRINKIINQAVAHGHAAFNPLKTYSLKKEKKEIIYLTEKELTRIQKLKIDIPRIEIVRQLFLLSCFTGLAYNELYRLTAANFETTPDKVTWIKIQRQKTNKWLRIPLLPQARSILIWFKNFQRVSSKKANHSACDRYSEEVARLLPVPSNQKMNAYLKEIADLARINKNLTSHVARKTFATTLTLLKGVSMESVSKLLGHSNLKVTQESYSEITDKKILKELHLG